MSELTGFYIIAREGVLLFSYELFVQGSEDWDLVLFSATISAMQSFASELGHKLAETIEIGDIKLYSALDDNHGLIFVAKSDSVSGDDVEIFGVLDNIKECFFEKYNIFFKKEYDAKVIAGELDVKIFNDFEFELVNLLKIKKPMEIFLESL